MIIGTGVDIVEIERIKKAVEKNSRFLERFFSDRERAYFESRHNRCEVAAGNFAAKEAFSKAIGTGIRNFALKDVEILRDSLGKPYINLRNAAYTIANKKGDGIFHVSISHCKHYAVATVTMEIC